MIRTTLLLAPLLSGCVFYVGDTINCDTMAVGSVNVRVQDLSGAPLPGADVHFRVDDGAEQPCDDFAGDGTFVCGWEQPGRITITAEAEGYLPVVEEVFVEKDECHVIPEDRTLTLEGEGVDCTAEEVPSIIATVVGSGGEELEGVEVSWGYADADMEPIACDPSGGAWLCGAEVSGDLEVYARAGGHALVIEPVTVGADECHVITERVEIALEWLPD